MTDCSTRMFLEYLKFGIVGVANTVVCVGLVYMLHRHLDANLWIASYTGYAIATLQSFFMNKYWTFSGNQKLESRLQLKIFIVANIIGSVFFSVAVNALQSVLGLMVATLLATFMVMTFNFLAARTFVFRRGDGDG